MKKMLLTALAILAAIGATAQKTQISEPDFAYPKTVLKSADSLYAVSVRNGDAVGQLEALILSAKADELIDNDTRGRSIDRALKCAGLQTDRQMQGLFDLYIAQLYSNCFNSNRWQYARRQLPLTPRPADVSEWSGGMFEAVIDSLCAAAWQKAGDMPLSSLSRVIEADRLTLQYFPTLRDFVAARISAIQAVGSSLKKRVAAESLAAAVPGSARFYYLTGLNMSDKGDSLADYARVFMNADDKYNALILWQFAGGNMGFDSSDAKYVNEALSVARATASGSWAEPLVSNLTERYNQPCLSLLRQSDYLAAGTPCEIKVSQVRNVGEFELSALRYADYESWRRAGSIRNPASPVSTTKFTYRLAGLSDTTITIALPAGYYLLKSEGFNGEMRVISTPVLPVMMSTPRANGLMVVDAAGGAPVQGVRVSVVDSNRKILWSASTPADGKVAIPDNIGGRVQLTAAGTTLFFNEFRINRINKENVKPTDRTSVTFTTDLGVVRPGDSIRWVAVAALPSAMAAGKTFNVVMSNADYTDIDSAKVITDEFGRATGVFAIPADSKTGLFRLSAKGFGSRGIAGSGSFAVSDFKVDGVKLSGLTAVPSDGRVTVSGTVTNYSGAGLGGSDIDVRMQIADTVLTAGALSGGDGKFSITFDIPANSTWCTSTVTATAPDGSTVNGTVTVDVRYSANLELSRCGSFNVEMSDGLRVNAVVTTAAGDSISVPLDWTLQRRDNITMAKGSFMSGKEVAVELPASLEPDNYLLTVAAADTTLCAPETINFVLYDSSTDKLPEKTAFWMPDDSIVGVSAPGVFLSALYSDDKGNYRCQTRELKGGYYNIYDIMDFGGAVAGEEIILVAVRNAVMVNKTVRVLNKKTGLKIRLESFRDKVVSGSRETWKFMVTDAAGHDVRAAVALNVYDLRLNSLRMPQRLDFSGTRVNTYPMYLGSSYGYAYSNMYGLLSLKKVTEVTSPKWKWLDDFYGSIRIRGRANAAGGQVVFMSAKSAAVEAEDYASPVADAVTTEGAESTALDAGEAPELDDVVLRVDDRFSALWLPMLTTGGDGRLEVPFDVPNANTGWQMIATAWDKSGDNAVVSRTFTSAKPVMVSLNAPQFVRGGDIVTVLASVVNHTDSDRNVTVRLESTATASMPVVDETTITMGANANTVVPISVDVPVLADSIRFVVRAISGDNSDGELVVLPVLPSQSTVTETQNFYLNPGQTSWSATLPASKGKDYEASLTFTGNPMWTIVSALPEVTGKEVCATAGSQARAYFGAAVTLSLMKQHPELGLRYKEANLRNVMSAARKVLAGLQGADGGWRWGEWSSASSVYVTADVLDVMATLKRNGMLEDAEMERMIQRALPYYDDNVKDTDLLYTIVRSAFVTPQQSLNGQKVTNATVQYINRNWKKFDTAQKALSACALRYTGNISMARTLLGSLDQFGTQTADKGFEFKNVRSLQTYAWLLECYGAISPDSPIVDGLRQYLIVRKQGEAWGNGIITTDIVASMINSGTPWTVDAAPVNVSVDGAASVPEQTDRLGQFTIPVKGNALTLTRTGVRTPAYGALITRYTAPSSRIKAYSDGEVSIEKSLMVQNADGTWRNFDPAADSLKVGQTVKTLLTVKADRPMSRVIVTDERAATLIPVNQLSGFVYGDGIFAYRENRTSATNLYLEYVPKGTWLLEYSFRVNNAGAFNTGVATATCSQAPTLTAHSSGYTLYVTR